MFILRRAGGYTAQNLAKLIGCRCSKDLIRIPSNDFVISYGQQYNKANLNANTIYNKKDALEILEENEILVPKVYSKYDNIPSNEYPLLGRKCYHSKGKDIVFIENEKELKKFNNEYSYLVKYIEKKGEYRVHILGNYGVFVSVKWAPENDKANELIRSLDKGWKQIEYNGEYRNNLIDIAKKTTKILKYDFGAVDIIRGNKGKLYVLEVNSAPGLEERKLKLYADYFLSEENKWEKSHSYKTNEVEIIKKPIEKKKEKIKEVFTTKKSGYELYSYKGE